MVFSPLISGTIPHNYVHGGFKRRVRGQKPSRFIVHHWAGTSGGDARLANPSQEASANYLVFSDGTIKGQVPEEYGAWTSGSAAADNPSITIEVQNSGGQVNGNNDDPNSWPISGKAWASLVRLLAEVAKRNGFDAGNIRFHREFDATACPGGYIWHRRGQLAADARKGAGSGGTTPKPPSGGGNTVSQLADEVIAGKWGNDPARTQALLAAGHDANAVQAEVNRRFSGGGSAPKPAAKTVAQLADEVLAGKHGNGADRQRSLGHQYAAVQAEVNRRLGGGGSKPAVNIDALARAVIRGEYGNGAERQRRLGANYAAVQARVNQILGG